MVQQRLDDGGHSVPGIGVDDTETVDELVCRRVLPKPKAPFIQTIMWSGS